MRLKWQLFDLEPVLHKDCVSVLRNVAERTKEVIPVENSSRIHTMSGQVCTLRRDFRKRLQTPISQIQLTS